MGIAIGVLLTVLAIAVVAWPFLRRQSAAGARSHGQAGAVAAHGRVVGGTATGPDPEATTATLREARGEVYRLIRQLELDHAAGLVTNQEFQREYDELRAEAATLLMREAELTRRMGGEGATEGEPQDAEARLEREIAEARAALAKAATTGGQAAGTKGRKEET